jgi:hypothetical protein
MPQNTKRNKKRGSYRKPKSLELHIKKEPTWWTKKKNQKTEKTL